MRNRGSGATLRGAVRGSGATLCFNDTGLQRTPCFNGDTVLQRRHCASTTRPPFDSASGTDGAYAAKLKQGHLRQGFRPQRFTGVHHARRIFDRLAVACWSTDQQFAGSAYCLTFCPYCTSARPIVHRQCVSQIGGDISRAMQFSACTERGCRVPARLGMIVVRLIRRMSRDRQGEAVRCRLRACSRARPPISVA